MNHQNQIREVQLAAYQTFITIICSYSAWRTASTDQKQSDETPFATCAGLYFLNFHLEKYFFKLGWDVNISVAERRAAPEEKNSNLTLVRSDISSTNMGTILRREKSKNPALHWPFVCSLKKTKKTGKRLKCVQRTGRQRTVSHLSVVYSKSRQTGNTRRHQWGLLDVGLADAKQSAKMILVCDPGTGCILYRDRDAQVSFDSFIDNTSPLTGFQISETKQQFSHSLQHWGRVVRESN